MRLKAGIGLLLLIAFPALAAEEDNFATLYLQVPAQYVRPMTTEDAAVNVLKGLTAADARLRVGDDAERVSLYYHGRLLKILRKPVNKDDITAWVRLSGDMVDAATEKSAAASQHDFELFDLMMSEAVKKLDGDSKYYASAQDLETEKTGLRRQFGSRMEGKDLYLKIVAFNNFTVEEIQRAVQEYPDSRGIILDLRGCSGGMLGEAVKTADLFLDEAIITSVRGRAPDSLTYYTAHDGDISGGRPMIVLVDGKTASAAEVLAAALQEQGRAKVVGTRTFGKGSIQNLIHFPGGGVLSLTSAYFYTPSGQALHGKGIVPDICTFEMPENKNIANLLAAGRTEECLSESREDTELELKTAAQLLEL